MFRKGAQDRLRSKIFSKLAKEISVAVKVGGSCDPAANSRLRAAIVAAKKESMPKENIERAVKKGMPGNDDSTYEDVRYEGYGPGNVAVIIEALTDNRNRTASSVKTLFGKHGGALSDVAFGFSRVGVIAYPRAKIADDIMFEYAAGAGADDVASRGDSHEIICDFKDLGAVRDVLEAKFGPAETFGIQWRANQAVNIDDIETARKLLDFIEALQDNDDVQKVFANHNISSKVMEKLE